MYLAPNARCIKPWISVVKSPVESSTGWEARPVKKESAADLVRRIRSGK